MLWGQKTSHSSTHPSIRVGIHPSTRPPTPSPTHSPVGIPQVPWEGQEVVGAGGPAVSNKFLPSCS